MIFNILLPTWDVFSDVKLSYDLFIGGTQRCSIEDKNIQEFKEELDLCLQNPQEYCQNDSNASYLCQENSQNISSCMKCRVIGGRYESDCINSNEGIREIYNQCLEDDYDYIELRFLYFFTIQNRKEDYCEDYRNKYKDDVCE